jgi:hypothetical protein
MNPELPKALAAAADKARTLSGTIEEFLGHLMKLKANLDLIHPALTKVHAASVSGSEPAFHATDVPPEVVPPATDDVQPEDVPPDEDDEPVGPMRDS